MQSDVMHFDRQGFIPSREINSIDGFLREAEKKQSLLEKLRRNPAQVLEEMCGVRTDAQLVNGGPFLQEKFFTEFQTELHPGIVLPETQFEAVLSAGAVSRFGATLKKYINGRERQEDYLTLEENGVSLQVPCFREPTEDINASLSFMNVSAIRAQWKRYSSALSELGSRLSLNRMGETYAEACVALSTDMKVPLDKTIPIVTFTNAIYRVLPIVTLSIFNGSLVALMAPYALGSPLAGFGMGALASAMGGGYNHVKAHMYQKNYIDLFEQCSQEGINASYLFMRASYREFNSGKGIREQLGGYVRHQIIKARLEEER